MADTDEVVRLRLLRAIRDLGDLRGRDSDEILTNGHEPPESARTGADRDLE
jgi:hypothetical protein